jgi:subtilase family serine protease
MTTMPALSSQKHLTVCGWLAMLALVATTVGAQTPAPRIQAEVSTSEMSVLKGSLNPLAQPQFDAGRVPANTQLTGITIVFMRSEAQQADLESLLAAQQNPTSPLFHQWLTPDQFGARFGMAQSDLATVQTWLEQQGFAVDSIGRSRNMIRFSGTAGQVEQAFQTQMHYFNVAGEKHLAPSTELSVPTAIAPVVETVRNLDNFKPRAMHIRGNPAFTSGMTGSVFFSPGDIKLIYDMNPLLSQSFNGSGQSIAIMGQSAIVTSDITNFQTAAGLTPTAPTQVLVPGTGTPQTYSGDQGESSLDLEWSGAMATGANIFFVYTGNSQNTTGVFDSISYAIDQKIGDIISVSYGTCETLLGTFSLESAFQQAASQGQTVVSAAGDTGSTGCWTGSTTAGNPTATQQQALAVNYPASSPNVLGVGGTEISQASSAYYTQGQGYWAAETSGTDIITSALKYIPEVVWNDSLASAQGGFGLSATGGGVSSLFAQPSFQSKYFTATGEANPNSSWRLVPDVALFSSPNYVPYLFCTSDMSNWSTGQEASCNSGFRDSATGTLTAAGGTSFATPIFAGMIAIINQKNGYAGGSGLINPALYQLASNASTYASGFHDITSGNNECPSGAPVTPACTGPATSSYSASTGYDPTTGLGSVDLNNLVTASGWPTASPLVGTSTTVAASNGSPNQNTSVTFTITVASTTGSSMPTGNVTISVDGAGTSFGSGSTSTVTLASNGTATYSTSFTTAGIHQVVAQYVPDSTHAASTGVAQVSVQGTSSPGTFALSATSVAISQGAQGTTTITVTPSNGYKGTVNITPGSSTASFCYSSSQAVVSGTAAVTTTMTLDTNLNDCGGAAVRSHGMHLYRPGSRTAQPTRSTRSATKAAIGLAGIFFAGLIGWRFRRTRLAASLIVLGILGFTLSACGGGSSSNSNDTPKGTYTITLTGQDSSTSTITASTTFTMTVN